MRNKSLTLVEYIEEDIKEDLIRRAEEAEESEKYCYAAILYRRLYMIDEANSCEEIAAYLAKNGLDGLKDKNLLSIEEGAEFAKLYDDDMKYFT